MSKYNTCVSKLDVPRGAYKHFPKQGLGCSLTKPLEILTQLIKDLNPHHLFHLQTWKNLCSVYWAKLYFTSVFTLLQQKLFGVFLFRSFSVAARPDSYRVVVAYPCSSSSEAHLAPRAWRRLATVLGGSSSSGVYVETHLSENFQLVLTHVTDLQVGIPSIPLDTTNGLWKIMMALINNTFPLNTYSILHWLCLSLCLQVLVCTIFKVRSRQK